jgi:hypothetical protein
MKSMEKDDDDVLDHIIENPILDSKYPYGLRIALTEKEFEKLDLDHQEAEVGGIVHGHFLGRITNVHQTQASDGNKCCRVEIQIEDLEIECEDDESEDEEE